MSTSQQSEQLRSPRESLLADAIAGLAEMPAHASGTESRLEAIARLTVERVTAADYASITTPGEDGYVIVAAGSDLAAAVDQARPAGFGAAELDPAARPDTAPTMRWPDFAETAPALGLAAPVSIPLHDGRGVTVAVLDVYGRDSDAMAPLIAGLAALDSAADEAVPPIPDAGADELLTGFARASATRATIRLAVDLLAGRTQTDAYVTLCARAAEGGMPLSNAAADVVRELI